ncbi:hypothetical protein [Vibrio methylphosphonaticus]|uniref:hypothetical protein n=1 Tax=Vibrio methylphosphonaticus TaxID=2946866 RepID=UPI00202A646A|nr:hypothetical protein [Vibrio methylphosphonaticus]MCL9776897.1 hypothetical protein [Vibrio methylphosphonaticus]
MHNFRSFDIFVLLTTSLFLYGCGGGSSDGGVNVTPDIDGFKVRQDLHVFDYVYGGSDFSVAHVIAYSNENHQQTLTEPHILFSSSARSTISYYFNTLNNQEITIALLDRNTQLVKASTQIIADAEQPYWVFAFGDSSTNNYSLYTVPRPVVTQSEQTVPVFVIDASTPNQHTASDLYLNGTQIIQGLEGKTLSQPLTVPKHAGSLTLELKREGQLSIQCLNVQATNYQAIDDTYVNWQESAWLIVFSADRHCHIKPINWQ